MKKNIAILAALSVATLTACGSKTDANEKNFGAAMTQYFDKKGDLCLNTKRWPVDLSEMDLRLQKTMQAGSANQMAALEAAGLVKGEDTEVDIMGIMGKPTGAKAKIKRKGCDWIVANDVSPATGVMGGDRNTVHLLTRDGDGIDVDSWPVMSKEQVASELVARIARQIGAST